MSFFDRVKHAFPTDSYFEPSDDKAEVSEHWSECEVRVNVSGVVLSDAFKDVCVIKSITTRFCVNEIPSASITLSVLAERGGKSNTPSVSDVVAKCAVAVPVSVQVRKRHDGAWIEVFSGLIELVTCDLHSHKSTIEIKAKHGLVRLQSEFAGQAFQNKSDGDILKELLGLERVQADKSNSLMTKRDQTIYWPFGASAWEFAKALLGRNGVCFWPSVKAGCIAAPGWSTEVVVVSGTSAAGTSIVSLKWWHSSRQKPKSIEVEQWDVQKQKGIRKQGEHYLHASGCFNMSKISSLAKDVSHVMKSGWLAPNRGATLKGIANGLALSSALQAARGTTTVRGCIMAAVGSVLKVEHVDTALCGEGVVTAIEYEFGEHTRLTTLTVGLAPSSAEIVSVPGPDGMIVGRVQAYDKTHARKGWNEIWVDVPGIRGGVRARYCGPYASKNAAVWFYPQLGDEVVLNMMAGDPCSLAMVGAMNNPVNTLPAGWTPDDEDKRGFQTTSLKVLFDQKKQRMEFIAGKDQHMVLDAKSGVSFDVKTGNFAVTTGAGNISLNAKKKELHFSAKSGMTLFADRGVKLESKKLDVEIKAKTVMKLSTGDLALTAGQSKVRFTQASISINTMSCFVRGQKEVFVSGGSTSTLSFMSSAAILKGPSVKVEGQKADMIAPMINLKP